MSAINTSTFTIRDSQLSDADEIAELCQQFGYRIDAQVVGESLNRIFNDPKQAVFIAACKENVVAWVHVFITDRIESKPFAEIGGLIVSANYRQQGIGSRLLAQVTDWVNNHGNMKLRVRCADQRKQAHEFYKAQGMTQTKTQIIFDNDRGNDE